MVYEHGAWALVGAIDGAATHLAEQVALKARITLVSSGSTDKTVSLARVPWMFSCLPSDEAQAPVLAEALGAAAAGGPSPWPPPRTTTPTPPWWSCAGPSPGDGSRWTRSSSSTRWAATSALWPAACWKGTPGRWCPRPRGGRPRAWSRSSATGATTGASWEAPRWPLPPSAGRPERRPRGCRARCSGSRRPEWDSFARMYENRWGEPPDHAAAQSYDAVRLVVAGDAARRPEPCPDPRRGARVWRPGTGSRGSSGGTLSAGTRGRWASRRGEEGGCGRAPSRLPRWRDDEPTADDDHRAVASRGDAGLGGSGRKPGFGRGPGGGLPGEQPRRGPP